MVHQSSIINRRSSMRAFTLVECLISLAISAILLTAMAVAFNASAINYRENEQMYQTINNARQALTRMTSQIRTAGYVDESTDPPTWYGVAHNAVPGNQCILYLPDHELITYEFRSADGKLYVVKNSTNESYVLCDNVTGATFSTTTDNESDATSVEISLTVRCGNFQRTVAAGAVVRKILSQSSG
jgi:prepilin-type N-terminal cleavage/methylation domain-containing protein